MESQPTTVDRACLLAVALEPFAAWLGKVSAADLLALVAADLGDARILDEFRPHGAHEARARPASPILHVVAGNTPHAALQSLTRGLLLGAHNRVKIPGVGLPDFERFVAGLPPVLRARVEIAREMPEAWLAEAGVVIVFGGDDAVEHFRARVRGHQIFQAHGHRVSLGVVFGDEASAARAAAENTALWDQRGCLSPIVFFVAGDARAWAGMLAKAFAALPADALAIAERTAEENSAHRAAREEWRFRAATDQHVLVWAGDAPAPLAWTVVFEGMATRFPLSPLGRFVFVRPLPADLPAALGLAPGHLGALGFWPPDAESAARATALGLCAPRTCPLDTMQFPPLTWHADGLAPLAGLVRWEDREAR